MSLSQRPARLPLRGVLLTAILVSALMVIAPAPDRLEAVELPPPVEIIDPTVRELGPISVLGDSVLRGALVAPPHIVQRLAERGWGPIRALGVPGMSSGHAPRWGPLTTTFWYDRWVAEGWDPQPIVLVIGANDVGLCPFFDSVCMRNSQRFIVDHIGAAHDIFIPRMNHFYVKRVGGSVEPRARGAGGRADERPHLGVGRRTRDR